MGLGLMRKQICVDNDEAPSSMSSSMHKKKSQTTSKRKSKIRIIHIFAPEIIKTDAANFRELVQRLTGKPTTADEHNCRKREKREKMERVGGHAAAEYGFREREVWRDANTGGGFLGAFPELDQFPFMEGTTHKDAYEDPQVAN